MKYVNSFCTYKMSKDFRDSTSEAIGIHAQSDRNRTSN